MMSLYLLLAPASADVRVLNGTGKPLIVDLVGDQGSVEGHALPPNRRLSEVLGKPLPDNAYETLIVKDEQGKELGRQRVVSRGNYAIVNWGDGISVRAAGNFRGRSGSPNRVGLLNLSGSRLTYRLTYANGEVSEGKTAELRDAHAATFVATGRHATPGSEVRLEVTSPDGTTATAKVETGGVYQLSASGNALRVDPIHVP